jgi:hypothetical protein
MTRAWRTGLALGCLAAAGPAAALEVVEAEVTHADGVYHTRFEVRINIDPVRARTLLTDYDRLPRLSTLITESRRLPGGDGGVRVHQTLHACALFVCRTVQRMLTVETRANGDILTRIDAAFSDFHHGEEIWQILPEQGGTRLRYRSHLAPAFFIPPFLGPWFLKHRLHEELETIARRLETLATPGG